MAFGIQIVPVGLGISEDQLHQEVKNLGLPKLHYRRPFDIDSLTAEAIVPQLAKPIEQARTSTKKNGRELLKSIINNLESELKPPPAKPPTLSAARKEWTFGKKKLCLHIAAGDIFELSDYDILVNSENDYMQMARPSIWLQFRRAYVTSGG
jgi:hypothetical protein